jgi:hypothetical protein
MSSNIAHDVLVRDDGRCFKCGRIVMNGPHSCHHRKLRSALGSDTPENRITLCGSGTTGCHGEVHNSPRASRADGYIVSRYREPEDIPVKHWERGFVFLTEDGDMRDEERDDD